MELTGGLGVGGSDTEIGVKEGSVGQPETAIRGESGSAESVAGGELPHPSSKLSETADEASHTDDGVGDGNIASMDVIHGQDEGRAGEGEETERTRVTQVPQLRGGVVNVGVGGEGAGGVSTATVVVTILVAEADLLNWCVGHLD